MARQAVDGRAEYITGVLNQWAGEDDIWSDVVLLFNNAHKNSILTTAEVLQLDPARTYAGTGGWGCFGPPITFPPMPWDYPNALYPMWIRDACAQYHSYLGVFGDYEGKPADNDLEELGRVIEGGIRASSDFLTREDGNYACWGKGLWPMALVSEGITLDPANTQTGEERKRLLKMIVETSQLECNDEAFGCNVNASELPCCEDGHCNAANLREKFSAKGYLRESFEIDRPENYTRGWFARVNAFFGEWIDEMVRESESGGN
jgi:hypothetical protein